MRLSELMGHEVVTESGRVLGKVHDVYLVQDGPMLGEWGAALRVHEIIVGKRSYATRLGYDRRDAQVKGPVLVRLLLALRRARHVPWSAIREIGERIIVTDDAAP